MIARALDAETAARLRRHGAGLTFDAALAVALDGGFGPHSPTGDAAPT